MNVVVIIILILLILWWFLSRSVARPSDNFVAMCSPGYMPTGSGCVPTDETIGSS